MIKIESLIDLALVKNVNNSNSNLVDDLISLEG
jgi:hypothetical protein